MTRNAVTIAFLMAILAVGTAAIAGLRLSSANERYEAAVERAERLSSGLTEVARLEAQQPTAFASEPPNDAVVAAVRAALMAAQITPRSLIRLDADTSASRRELTGEDRITTSRVRVDLQNLTPPELGRFLTVWTTAEPLWKPVEITLDAEQRSPGRFRITILLEARYLARARSPEVDADV